MRKPSLRKKDNKQRRARNRPVQRQPPDREAVKDSRARRPVWRDDSSRRTERVHLGGPERTWRRAPLYGLLFLIAALLTQSTLIDVGTVHVRVVHPNGASQLSSLPEDGFIRREDYGSAAASALRSEIRNRSKFTVHTSAIERELRDQFPELQAVALQLHFFDRTPVIRVVPRMPELLVNSSDKDNAYYVDARGVVIAEADDRSALDVPVITDEVGLDLAPGSRVLPIDTIAFIENIRLQLDNANLAITEMRLPAVANELHVEVEGDNYFGKFDIAGDVRRQAGSFIAVRERVTQQGAQPNEYIDVRIPGRAYYR